jgi:hypothetical protein
MAKVTLSLVAFLLDILMTFTNTIQQPIPGLNWKTSPAVRVDLALVTPGMEKPILALDSAHLAMKVIFGCMIRPMRVGPNWQPALVPLERTLLSSPKTEKFSWDLVAASLAT